MDTGCPGHPGAHAQVWGWRIVRIGFGLSGVKRGPQLEPALVLPLKLVANPAQEKNKRL